MTNEGNREAIRPWIDPKERVTVNFLDEQGLNAEVTDCNDVVVDLSLETQIPHIKQHISIPLRRAQVPEDPSHCTRNPDRPLKLIRLMPIIDEKRPPIVY